MQRICNFNLNMREGSMSEKSSFSDLDSSEREKMIFNVKGSMIGECLERNMDFIIHHDSPSLAYNTQIDLELKREHTVISKTIRML